MVMAGNSRRIWPAGSPRQGITVDTQKLSAEPRSSAATSRYIADSYGQCSVKMIISFV